MGVRALGLVGAVLGLAMVAPAIRAETVFSNFTEPGNTYQGNSWWTVGSVPGTTNNEANAFSFSPSATVTVTGADLALAAASAATPLTVYIESNTGSGPGTVLDTLTQTGSYGTYPTTSYVSFACTLSCSTLDAGTEYWIVATADDPASTTYWMWSYGDTGSWYYNYSGSATGPWSVANDPAVANPNTAGAFDVTGTAVSGVPEPASLALAGSGMLAVLGVVRRRAWRA